MECLGRWERLGQRAPLVCRERLVFLVLLGETGRMGRQERMVRQDREVRWEERGPWVRRVYRGELERLEHMDPGVQMATLGHLVCLGPVEHLAHRGSQVEQVWRVQKVLRGTMVFLEGQG